MYSVAPYQRAAFLFPCLEVPKWFKTCSKIETTTLCTSTFFYGMFIGFNIQLIPRVTYLALTRELGHLHLEGSYAVGPARHLALQLRHTQPQPASLTSIVAVLLLQSSVLTLHLLTGSEQVPEVVLYSIHSD